MKAKAMLSLDLQDRRPLPPFLVFLLFYGQRVDLIEDSAQDGRTGSRALTS